jgi:hypothetical protein
MSNFTTVLYFLGNVINVLTTIAILIVVFFDKENIVSNKDLMFLIFINLTTHITERTKNIQD